MRKFYFLSLMMALLVSLSAAAKKTNSITGTIKDESKNGIENLAVFLYQASDAALVKTSITDKSGQFSFSNVKNGQYFIKVSSLNHEEHKSEIISIENNAALVNEIILKSKSKSLNQVNIVAKKPFVERKVDKTVVNVEGSSVAVGATALELLQKAPGISVDQNDNISMQGKQGVLIQIDGKMTYMSGADVTNLLKNMQSSEIQTIELMTNPSSKYDASGNSGIINIKTKKGKSLGTNGSVNAGVGYGKFWRANSGVNFNNRSENTNVFGSFNSAYNKGFQTIDIDRIANGTPNTYFMQKSELINTRTSNNFKIGTDYFINKNNTLGFLVNGFINQGKENIGSTTQIGPAFNSFDSFISSENNGKRKFQNMAYNLNYKSVLDTLGQEISVDVDYAKYNGNEKMDLKNQFYLANGANNQPDVLLNNDTPSDIDIKSFKIDYILPLNKTLKFEAGVKSSWVKTDNELIATQLKDNAWQNVTSRSNHFIYDENVNAAYANLSKEFKTTKLQIGLRAENTASKGNLITTDNVVKRNYLDFFPSLFVSQKLSEHNQMSFSYSRRLDRPDYDALNPFIEYLDQYTYQKGNPFLNPQYTHNFELNYTFYDAYSLTLGYSKVNDVITEVILPDHSTKSLFATKKNLAQNTNFNVNLNFPIEVTKWWNFNNDINVFYLGFKSPNLEGVDLNTGKTSYQIKSQHSFTIMPGLSAELNGSYESPLVYGTLSLKSRQSIDAGLNKSLWKKSATLKVTLNDVFNTLEQNLDSSYPGLSYSLHQKRNTQMIRVAFTYRFGNKDVKAARRRSNGSDSEQGRLKS
ncbi:MAG: TonB-dependent receptor [Sphingobacteriaceae bacterium]|nr:TonB-dependent receptor [Sphingobacteriaceae bacterium]